MTENPISNQLLEFQNFVKEFDIPAASDIQIGQFIRRVNTESIRLTTIVKSSNRNSQLAQLTNRKGGKGAVS